MYVIERRNQSGVYKQDKDSGRVLVFAREDDAREYLHDPKFSGNTTHYFVREVFESRTRGRERLVKADGQ